MIALLDAADQITDLLEWDQDMFVAINTGWTHPILDRIMPWLREPLFWTPVYAFFISFLVINFGRKGMYITLFAVLTFVMTDQISAGYIKPRVNRMRPCNDVMLAGEIIQRVECGSGKSFPSTHATNHFGFSLFLIAVLGKRIRGLTIAALLWATSVGLAQIYVGLHFPIDVIFGGLLGASIGLFTGSLANYFVPLPDEHISSTPL